MSPKTVVFTPNGLSNLSHRCHCCWQPEAHGPPDTPRWTVSLFHVIHTSTWVITWPTTQQSLAAFLNFFPKCNFCRCEILESNLCVVRYYFKLLINGFLVLCLSCYLSFNEIKICLLLGRKVMTNLDCIFKSRDITLPTKAHLDKAMVFPVVMYGCESWTIKKAEHQRIDAFEW